MRIIRGSERASYTTSQRLTKAEFQKALARRAAINKAYAAYIELTCGHYTDMLSDQQYRHWRPNKHVSWCEHCQDWIVKKPPYVPAPQPEEPMF